MKFDNTKQSIKEIKEAILILEGLQDMLSNNIYDGEEVIEDLKKKYNL